MNLMNWIEGLVKWHEKKVTCSLTNSCCYLIMMVIIAACPWIEWVLVIIIVLFLTCETRLLWRQQWSCLFHEVCVRSCIKMGIRKNGVFWHKTPLRSYDCSFYTIGKMAEYFYYCAWNLQSFVVHLRNKNPNFPHGFKCARNEGGWKEGKRGEGGGVSNNQLLTCIFLVFYNFATWRVGTLVE